MTKKELLSNPEFIRTPDDAEIIIPNITYQEGVDEREEVPITVVKFWDFRNELYFD